MFFKNLQIYRLPAPWAMSTDHLAAQLELNTFTPASSNELIRQGWAPPRADGQLVHVINGQYLLQLKTEKKLLPATVINQVAKARAAELEEAQGFAPGKKAMKEIKEKVADELLPRAFGIETSTLVWIDPKNGWLVVDAASPSKADDVIKLLLKAVDRMPLESLRVQRSPVAVMTGWLESDEAPAGFTVDQDATLRATGESKAQVGYKHHALEPDDVRRHIAAGKQCTRLAMTWNDKVSFVLTEGLALKSVKPLDVIREGAPARDDLERFDSDFALMSGELARLLADLVEALGGEASDLASPAGPVLDMVRGGIEKEESYPGAGERITGIASMIYGARTAARQVYGAQYRQRMDAMGLRIMDVMAENGMDEIAAASFMCKQVTGAPDQMEILAAAVEMIEPSTGAAA